MFETLFGSELPLPVRFFLAFLVVLGTDRSDRVGGAPVRYGPARRRQRTRPSAASWRYRLRQRRRPPPSDPGAPGQCRTSSDDRRTDRRGRRGQHHTRGSGNVARRPVGTPASRGTAAARNSIAGKRQWLVAIAARAGDAACPASDAEIRAAAEEPRGHPAAAGRRDAGQPQRDTLAALADELSARPTPPPRNRSPLPTRTTTPAEPRSEPRPEPRDAGVATEQPRRRRIGLKPRQPIRASPRWRIASKRHCASPARRRPPRHRHARRCRRNERSACGCTACPAARAPPNRRQPKAPRAKQNRTSQPRSTTTSSRRWQVCWAARQTRTE